ncbi:alpha,alpha-trehalase TreA [Erwinia pyrifoliae]|uniref:Periplasmic trehalase n=1 Tax=Erwinia pyrifoliae TaxID=79967 RepID=A0ABY5X3G6_ERWPY|nr:alpha,alpha-trehalase TreA [Erwinia pyrifoliae]AUX72512.1 alpha,alpha-trehalase TreA [Erwinia pyrifoliae]MCA8877236.1 alpha,alpha-trehalase TreA [Erwinia pyrifoliae]MCT2387419.1 alpha,alpha-trehalase TreA [Erwinia pyrifoliae]MCU8586981.1 alpha,alpha-trehalase TreA [Erwinia pyrifoliae]UWS30849.1 alpha,alpha-trehalase TreA [Erwinia pyrifoliae]
MRIPSRHQSHILLFAPLLLAGALVTSCAAQAQESQRLFNNTPQPPDVRLGPLFAAVQAANLYPDQKTFADAVPKNDPSLILSDWQMQKMQQNFDLRHFVAANFTLPAADETYVSPPGQSLRAHINALWPLLTRSSQAKNKWDSLLTLPKPYVVPGGRFREVYYWDSYFTMLGLAESGHWDRVQDMVDNFAYQLDKYGHIPNGNRSYYLSRSQPPFFSMMVDLLARHGGDKVYSHYLPQLEKEYNYWMAGADSKQLQAGGSIQRVVKLTDGTLLNRYWDERDVPRTESWMADIATAQKVTGGDKAQLYRDLRAGAASGWDFSSRWFDKPDDLATLRTTKILPVDLNALIFHLETTLARASQIANNHAASQRYQQLAERRKIAIARYMWDEKQGWYADYDWQKARVRPQLTAAALFPLYLRAANDERARRTAIAVNKHLLKEGGLVTTRVKTDQQWDAPNGWAPLQWVAVEGLNHYGQQQLAKDIALRFLNSVQATYDNEHKLVEKYVVEGKARADGGEYPLQDGFGWTNAVTLKLLDLYCPHGVTCNNAGDLHGGKTSQ